MDFTNYKEELSSACVYYYGNKTAPAFTTRKTISMIDAVDGDKLQEAVDIATRRFPFLQVRLVRTDTKIYLEHNPLPVVALCREEAIDLNSEESNYNLVAFTYWENDIFIHCFHGLLDGKGSMAYLSTVMLYYCRLKYDPTLEVPGIRQLGEEIDPEEYTDPMAKQEVLPGAKSLTEIVPPAIYHSFSDDPRLTSDGQNYTYRLHIPQQSLMACCKKHDTSPIVEMMMMATRAIEMESPVWDKDIVAYLCADLRPTLGVKLSHHSTIGFLPIAFTRKLTLVPPEWRGTALRGQVILDSDPAQLVDYVHTSKQAFDQINALPTYKEKQEATERLIDQVARSATYMASYTGKTSWGDMERYVKAILVDAEVPGFPMIIEVGAIGTSFFVTFCQRFREDYYFKAFRKQLEAAGIENELFYEGVVKKARCLGLD